MVVGLGLHAHRIEVGTGGALVTGTFQVLGLDRDVAGGVSPGCAPVQRLAQAVTGAGVIAVLPQQGGEAVARQRLTGVQD